MTMLTACSDFPIIGLASQKKIYLYFLFFLPYIQSIQSAYQIAGLANYVFIVFLSFFVFRLKISFKKIQFFCFNRAVLLYAAFWVCQFCTIFTAGNDLYMLLSSVKFLIPVFAFVMMPYLLSISLIDLAELKQLIVALSFVSFFGLIAERTFLEPFILGGFEKYEMIRWGVKNSHSFFAHHNTFAHYTLAIIIILIYNFRKSFFTKFANVLLLVASLSRISIVAFVFSGFCPNFKRFRYFVFFYGILFALILLFFIVAFVNIAFQDELADFPRAHYTVKGLEIFSDHPFFGVGLNRITNKSYWEHEKYLLQNQYNILTTWGSGGQYTMSSTDTYLVFPGEIGLAGSLIFCLIFAYFTKLSIQLKNFTYIGFQTGMFFLLVHAAFPFTDYAYGMFMATTMGILLNESFHKNGVLEQ